MCVWHLNLFSMARVKYAASQTVVLHMKRLNQTESLIFVILCVLCFQRQTFLTFNTILDMYKEMFNT